MPAVAATLQSNNSSDSSKASCAAATVDPSKYTKSSLQSIKLTNPVSLTDLRVHPKKLRGKCGLKLAYMVRPPDLANHKSLGSKPPPPRSN